MSIFQMSQEDCYYFKIYISCRIFGYLPSEIFSDSNEKERPKEREGFLRPISKKITLAKEKGKEDHGKREKKEGRRREKTNGCTLNFYILGYYR